MVIITAPGVRWPIKVDIADVVLMFFMDKVLLMCCFLPNERTCVFKKNEKILIKSVFLYTKIGDALVLDRQIIQTMFCF